jgi:hypothetical protein
MALCRGLREAGLPGWGFSLHMKRKNAIRLYRFAGFANLALKDAESAAKELERGIRELGFNAGFLNRTEGGAF